MKCHKKLLQMPIQDNNKVRKRRRTVTSYIQDTDENTTLIVIEEPCQTNQNENIKDTNEIIKDKYKQLISTQSNKINVNSDQNNNTNENNESTNNEDTNNESKQGSRKRKRQTQNWKQNVRKRYRQSGKEYINAKGKTVESKRIKTRKDCKGHCKYKCSDKISTSERKRLFDSFWSLNDSAKNVFYSRTVIRYKTKRHRTSKQNSRKQFSYEYNFILGLIKVRVCKEFYLSTLDISARRIQWYFDHKNPDFEDKKGQHIKYKIPEAALCIIRDHINSFPRVESHYCRANSSRKYLEPTLSLSKMYQLYTEKCQSKSIKVEKSHIYRSIFNSEFNLGFHIPKKDRCDQCEEFKSSSKNNVLTDEFKKKYENHIENKNNAKVERDQDRHSIKPVVCFDMQNVITCPRANISNFFYKRKLNIGWTLHNQEVDNVHSHIEKALHLNEIYSPVSCMRVLTNVRKRSMKVIQMKESDFMNFQKASLSYAFSEVPFTKVSQLKLNSSMPCHVKYKKAYGDESYTEVSVRKQTRKGSGGISGFTPPKIVKLGKTPTLSKEKIADIKTMYKYMPVNDRRYFEKVLK
ncbi:unnamed protein product [Mytilus coruscus]|uniref:Uncharacterized protein n=1 Tax=Mytilus coruscus TaxID=42192 RepID=A0A6J7ZVB2_MYTCO|nr:unnamed protein product [Mytilus coruscus]